MWTCRVCRELRFVATDWIAGTHSGTAEHTLRMGCCTEERAVRDVSKYRVVPSKRRQVLAKRHGNTAKKTLLFMFKYVWCSVPH
jgi:hypothetical protein